MTHTEHHHPTRHATSSALCGACGQHVNAPVHSVPTSRIPKGAAVVVRHETGTERGECMGVTSGAGPQSVLVRFADRTEAWFPASRVDLAPEPVPGIVVTITLPTTDEPDQRGWTADLESLILAAVEDTYPGPARFTYSAVYTEDVNR